MTFEQAAQQYIQFKSSGAPVVSGVKIRSRGKVMNLSFDLQLIDGAVAIVAKLDKDEQPTESAKPAKTRR